MTTGLQLGAPGVYRTARGRAEALVPERLDVAGFVGVASRGPVDTPVAVESWSEYLWRFGSTDGPGRLPLAVYAFFVQGGTRAVVLRVSPLPRAPDPRAVSAVARHELRFGRSQAALLLARDEGSWGTQLEVRCDFDATERFRAVQRGTELELPAGVALPSGSLLRLRRTGLPVTGVLVWGGPVVAREAGTGRRPVVTVRPAGPPGPAPAPGAVPVEVAVVTATITVVDRAPDVRRAETFGRLGLSASHPRWAGAVLTDESRLVTPGSGWGDDVLPADALLPSVTSRCSSAGRDRWEGIGAGSLTGDLIPESMPLGGPEGLDPDVRAIGIDRMALVPEIGLLAVPDLLWADASYAPPPDRAPVRRRPAFERCTAEPAPVRYRPTAESGLLDPASELDEVLRRQGRLVRLAERQRRFVALLDVPPHLPVRSIARWRAAFDSSFAAAYHPWLGTVDPADPYRRVRLVPPTAFAAGIIADRERRLGISWGPANELALSAVTAADPVGDEDHDPLHRLGIDVFRSERDGFRLSSARTLSTDPDYDQLTVRRLMTVLALVLQRQTQRLVFEPNAPALWEVLRSSLRQVLRGLFRAGAFTGATEDEAFFVRCDETLNPAYSRDAGRVVAEVGVAPAQPLEYLVLRVSQDADGLLGVEG